ncbi:hypothetical protein AMEX_G14552 [Astyanax mexicanus]|uniref:Heart development protein with EGF-like domains 1 n=1 Tax=Astyanax mexicanus TaxID=7994 RepID=A0A8B9LYP5_ASTMX|nr:hypothetical protein AMEX_G14552 [Astyanax mexicanus]
MRISLRDPVFQWWPGPPLRMVCLEKLAVFFMMEVCAARRPGRVFPLPLTLTLLLLLPLLKTASAGSFAPSTDSSITGETYSTQPGSTNSQGTAGVMRGLTSSTEELSSTNYGHFSTAGGSESHPGFREREASTATDQSSFTDTESWTSPSVPEVSTELLSTGTELSTATVTEWEDPSTVANITNVYPGLDRTERQAETETSETRTERDLTVTNLTEKDITEKDVTDTTESVSHTDSTYISTTISRAGERTLLSILSNSTSSYTEESSSSEVSPLTVTSEEWKTETTVVGKNSTEGLFSTEGVLSTEADQTRATFENDMTTNASQQETMLPSEPEVTHDSQGTQSHTGQPNVTESSFEATSDGSSSNSTLPFTVVSSSESSSKTESETAADSSTSGTSYTDSSASESSITPAVSPEDSHTNTSQQESETMTTETSTSTVNTEDGKKPESPQTHMDETTIPGLTTAPPTLTTTDDSLSKFLSGQRPFVPQTNHPEETTEVLTTAAGPATHRPWHTEEDTREASTAASSTIASTVFPTTLSSTSTSPAIPPTTHQLQQSTAAKTHTPYVELSTIETTQMLTTPTSEPHPLTTKTPTTHQSSSSSQPVDISTDVSTLHLETSTATPGNTTAHGKHTTVSYSKTAPTRSTAVVTTGKSTDRGSTQEADTTTQISVKSTPTPGLFCANGGLSVPTSEGGYRCACLPAWKGATCTEDVNECVSSPCPLESECVNTSGSFSCKCPLGYDLEDGRSCTQAKTFLGKFSVNSSLHLSSTSAIPHDLHKEILHLLNSSLSVLHGYRRSILRNGKELDVSNMFSMSANVTSSEVYRNIQAFLRNCSKPNSRCTLKLHYQLTYQVDSLCRSQKNKCDSQSSVCRDDNGTLYCQCKEGFFKKNPEDTTCRDCGDGFERVNGTCVGCTFGFGGFNCNNFYGLIAKVVSPAAGGLLLIVIIALIVTCCRKDKNDINKIIFKSGDLQMSPYAEFPKSSRVSMEWGRETIEMQENGSTKNLLQMTDIYYSPALRNADLERNGLYPFSGLPGSRHSCIYPAQWNPSFISDDSRRRDYF